MFKYNLGDKTAEIYSDKNTYGDGKWHQVVASRSGTEGSLIVKTHEQEDDVSTGSTGGLYNQLEMTAQATKIYAGGVPDNFTLPSVVRSKRFVGGLDDFSYSENQLRLGLWNFVDGQENNEGELRSSH